MRVIDRSRAMASSTRHEPRPFARHQFLLGLGPTRLAACLQHRCADTGTKLDRNLLTALGTDHEEVVPAFLTSEPQDIHGDCVFLSLTVLTFQKPDKPTGETIWCPPQDCHLGYRQPGVRRPREAERCCPTRRAYDRSLRVTSCCRFGGVTGLAALRTPPIPSRRPG